MGGGGGAARALTTLLLLCPQMLSCLEHMYQDLGLVRDFSINRITLKRWLVSARPSCALNTGSLCFSRMHGGPLPGGTGLPADGGGHAESCRDVSWPLPVPQNSAPQLLPQGSEKTDGTGGGGTVR